MAATSFIKRAKTKITYPALMENDEQVVVLFHQTGRGVVVGGEGWIDFTPARETSQPKSTGKFVQFGQAVTDLDMSRFRKFNGELTLKSE